MRVLQRFLPGLYRERTEIAIRERAKRSLPDADDGYWSHTFRITPHRANSEFWLLNSGYLSGC